MEFLTSTVAHCFVCRYACTDCLSSHFRIQNFIIGGITLGVQDIHYNEYLLLEQLEVCADMLEKAERFELLGHLYRLIVPMYEEKRSYEALANCYTHLAQACNKIVEVTKSGKRLLGRFYRVAFFGSVRIIKERSHRS